MNRDLRRSALLLALPVAAASLSLAPAGEPAGQPAGPLTGPPAPVTFPTAPAPPDAPVYTVAEQETLRTQLRESLVEMSQMAAVTNPGVFERQVADALAMIDAYGDDELNHLLSSGADFGAVRTAVSALGQAMSDLGMHVGDPQDGDSPADSPGFPQPEYSFVGSQRPHWGFKVAAFTALNLATLLNDTTDRVCQQTWYVPFVGSFDCSVCCIPTSLIKALAWAFLEGLNFVNGDITSVQIEASFERTCHVHNDLLAVQGQQDAMDAKLDALLVKLDELVDSTAILRQTSCEHIRLIQLPQKERASDLRACPH